MESKGRKFCYKRSSWPREELEEEKQGNLRYTSGGGGGLIKWNENQDEMRRRRMRRRACSINQEVIGSTTTTANDEYDELFMRMDKFNGNDYFDRKPEDKQQQQLANGDPVSPLGGQKEADQGHKELFLFRRQQDEEGGNCERLGCNDGCGSSMASGQQQQQIHLQHIVEDGKSKLRRQRKQMRQRQHGTELDQNLQQDQTHITSTGKPQQQQQLQVIHMGRAKLSSKFKLPFKSPTTFASNTLDEDVDLNGLATSGDLAAAAASRVNVLRANVNLNPTANCLSERRLLPAIGQDKNGRDKVVEVGNQKQQQQPPEHLNNPDRENIMMAMGCYCANGDGDGDGGSKCRGNQVTDCGCKTNSSPSSSLLSTINMNLNRKQQQQHDHHQQPPSQTLNVNPQPMPANDDTNRRRSLLAPRFPRESGCSCGSGGCVDDNDDNSPGRGAPFTAALAGGRHQAAASATTTTATTTPTNPNMNDTNATGCLLHPSGSGDQSGSASHSPAATYSGGSGGSSASCLRRPQTEPSDVVVLLAGELVVDGSVDMDGAQTVEWNEEEDENEDDDEDYDQASRGGPTPTNDLIRALIHKDRMALLTAATQAQAPLPLVTSNSPVTMASPLARSGARAVAVAGQQPIDNSNPLAAAATATPTLFSVPNATEKRGPKASGASGNHYQASTILERPTRVAANLSSGKRLPHNISNNDDTTITKAGGNPAAAAAATSPHPPTQIHSEAILGVAVCEQAEGKEEESSKLASQDHYQYQTDKRNETGKAGEEDSKQQPKRSAFDLASLINKCQGLQLSDGKSLASSLAPGYQLALRTLRSVSPRRPSEAPRMSEPDAAGLTAAAAAASTQRRHSTYMFPLILNQVPQTSDDDDDDDDDGEEEDGYLQGDERDGNPEGGRRVADGYGQVAEMAARGAEGGADASVSIANDNININNGKDGIVSSKISGQVRVSNNNNNNNNSTKLRNSTSSPSALSTPTNDKLEGCGGPCCVSGNAISKQRQPQAEISNDGRQHHQFQGGLSQQQQQNVKSVCEGSELRKLSSSSLASGNRKVSMVSSSPFVGLGLEQAQSAVCGQLNNNIGRRRGGGRIGSGPLDVFDGMSDPGGPEVQQASGGGGQFRCLALRQQQQQQLAASGKVKPNHGPGKRHSLISSVLSGVNQQVGGNHLVSRLTHPRSLFSNSNQPTASDNQTQPYNHRQQRASVECAMMVEPQYDPIIPESGFKIVVMGASGSGKTSIIQRFIYNSFSWRHNPTVEDTYFIEFPYMKNTINISISDTSGTYQFPAMRRLAINSGDAFILVYSVDNPNSLEDLKQLRQTILDEREQAYSEVSASMISNESSSSGLASSSLSQTSASFGAHHHQQQLQSPSQSHQPYPELPISRDPSPARHWSLASIFNSHHHQHHHQQQQHLHQIHQEHQQQQQHHQQFRTMQGHLANHSLNSSICSPSLSCSSSADNSRRSSVSAAEAALKTRRTPHPPMVIVGNKQDLPDEQHLVDSDEIQMQAQMDWNNGFVRASAALNLNIDEIFQQVMKQAKQPPTLTEAIVSKRRKSLPPKLPHQ